ncbi:MAG: aspartate/glutamate racemase family protein [Bacilli bacterium]|nr:aspartate/glutamate racemase family protein [Bacilli bacterium]MBQ8472082.1 aspartate/glutamate racemase family protein [Bacilli bacterium]
MDNRKIAVFDSGVGGLTTLAYLKEMLPNEDYVYFGDFKNNPYGTKTTSELQSILKNNIELLEKKDVKIIVIACNTAGTQIDYLKTLTNVPLCEPITVTTNYINQMNDVDNILLLATNYTVRVGLYQKYLNKFNVIGQPAQELVRLAEEKKFDQKVIDEIMKEYENKVDLVILGCTHFGYFTKEIDETVKPKIIVESSYELAKYVVQYLTENDLLSGVGNANVEFVE